MKQANSTHTQLAERLLNWASERGVQQDPYVIRVSRDLTQRKNWPFWATIDPLELLPFPVAAENEKLKKVNFYLTLIRNILVFVPVALTWDAVSHATSAFAIYINQNSNSVVNFLEFWQNGFKVLSKGWVIGRIAFLDFMLIAVVILLTLVVSVVERVIDTKKEQLAASLDSARMEIGLELAEFFYAKRTITPGAVSSNIANVLNRLLKVSESVERMTKTLELNSKSVMKGNFALFEAKQKLREARKN
jgi:ABC-type multidrug transport system fused ATPase/permease subunit